MALEDFSPRDQQFVSLNGHQFLIHDWDRLAELGDFDPAYLPSRNA